MCAERRLSGSVKGDSRPPCASSDAYQLFCPHWLAAPNPRLGRLHPACRTLNSINSLITLRLRLSTDKTSNPNANDFTFYGRDPTLRTMRQTEAGRNIRMAKWKLHRLLHHAVSTSDSAMRPGTPPIHDFQTNSVMHFHYL